MMNKRWKIAGALAAVALAAIVGIVVYVNKTAPPNEEWISYDNEQVIKVIDNQLQDADIDEIIQKKSELIKGKNILELQQLVANGEITYKEITAICLHYIKTLDQSEHGYNSVITVADDALKQAEDKDIQRKEDGGEISSMIFGIPVMLKDNIHTKGIATSSGTVAFADYIPEEDAGVTAALRNEGAVILGKNNMAEFANFISRIMPNGYSGRKGQTVNPISPIKISPSGSSSGSAVSVASELVPISIGTETAGSIIGPAAINGVVGFKPTRDSISNEGVFPLVKKVDTAGVLSKYVEDSAITYQTISGNKINLQLDPSALESKTVGLAVYSYNNEATIETMRKSLKEAGANIVDIEIDGQGIQVQNIISSSFRHDFENFTAQYSYPITSLEGLIEYNKEDPKRRIKYGQDLLEEALKTESDIDLIDSSIDKARKTIESLFEKNNLDVIAFLNTSGSTAVSAAGYPEITVPLCTDKDGIPQGITFSTRYKEDEKLLNMAYSFENRKLNK